MRRQRLASPRVVPLRAVMRRPPALRAVVRRDRLRVRRVPLVIGVLGGVRVGVVTAVATGVHPGSVDHVRPAEIVTIEIGRPARR